MTFTLAELARRCEGRVRGDPEIVITGVATLDGAGPREIAYVASKKYHPLLAQTAAGAVILREAEADRYAGNAIIAEDPRLCFAKIASLLEAHASLAAGVHPSAVVDGSARVAPSAWIGAKAVVEAGAVIGEQAFVGPGCFVGREAQIGPQTRLVANVTVYPRCAIGRRCLVHAGAVIGSDGFGLAWDRGRWLKVPQLGRVVMGDDVEVGANTVIDRGALGDTVIGDGVKLDNLIQIAHNVQVGEHTAMAAFVGIAGSAVIGKRCTIGGQAAILGHIEITDDVQITATSYVGNSISEPGVYSATLKAEPVGRWRRIAARVHQLDELARRLRQLEQEVDKITKE